YFKGGWRRRFDPARTVEGPFRTEDGRQVRVPLMHTDGTFRYGWTPDFVALELPYGNAAFNMTILVPHDGRSAIDVAASLDQQSWDALVAGLVEQRLDVVLPRFRLEYE